MHAFKAYYKRVWFLWGHLVHAHAMSTLTYVDTKAHRIKRKCAQYATWIQARQSKGVQVHVVATERAITLIQNVEQ